MNDTVFSCSYWQIVWSTAACPSHSQFNLKSTIFLSVSHCLTMFYWEHNFNMRPGFHRGSLFQLLWNGSIATNAAWMIDWVNTTGGRNAVSDRPTLVSHGFSPIIKWDPFWGDQTSSKRVVIWGKVPFFVHCLGWCHIMNSCLLKQLYASSSP